MFAYGYGPKTFHIHEQGYRMKAGATPPTPMFLDGLRRVHGLTLQLKCPCLPHNGNVAFFCHVGGMYHIMCVCYNAWISSAHDID
jgi:hypothetical protein